jgi:hypothetical protein
MKVLGTLIVLLFATPTWANLINKTGRSFDDCELRAIYYTTLSLGLYEGPNEPSADLLSLEKVSIVNQAGADITAEFGGQYYYRMEVQWTWDGDAPTGGKNIVLAKARHDQAGACALPDKKEIGLNKEIIEQP